MNFYSQAGQDRFAHEVLVRSGFKPVGTFLDIGCSHPRSNTLGLEEIGWSGLLMDIGPAALDGCTRKSKFIVGDAVKYDWSNEPNHFDYLSLDIDHATLACLKNLPDRIKYHVITIEHDLYQYPSVKESPQPEMREILRNRGYIPICLNVGDYGGDKLLNFEDWWVSPAVVNHANKFNSDGKYWKDIFGI